MIEYSVRSRLEFRLWFSGCCVITGRPPIALSHLTDHLQRDAGDELDDLFDSLLCKVTSTKFALLVPSPPFLVLSPSYLWISPLPLHLLYPNRDVYINTDKAS